MSSIYKLHKGLDIPLQGVAKKEFGQIGQATLFAIKPTDFKCLTPRLLVKEGDDVMVGTAIMADKMRPDILFTSPVSGTVEAVVRGDKRKVLEVRIKSDGQFRRQKFTTENINKLEDAKKLLLESGLWPMLTQRPYGIVANSQDTPKGIFISAFDTAPLAPDMEFALSGMDKEFQAGIDLLNTLCPDKVHLSICAKTQSGSMFRKIKNVQLHEFQGKHPAGNVGVQIHHIDAVNKGDVVWTVDVQNVVIIGRLVLTGELDFTKVVAITGASTKKQEYVRCLFGTQLTAFAQYVGEGAVRCISGNVLTGDSVAKDGFLGFFHNSVTFIPEVEHPEVLGWANPLRLSKFSAARTYITSLLGGRKFNLDTCMNGGVRAFVMNTLYNDVLPMDIYPVYLLKAILAKDIDRMEALGIYEVVEEDFALCEFVCPCKIEIQQIIRQGIELMLKEMA